MDGVTLTAIGEATADGGLGATLLTALVPALVAGILAYLRGFRFLGPLIAAIDWFRAHGAADLDLGGLNLSSEQQRQIRMRVQKHLRHAIGRAITSVMDRFGLAGPFRALVLRVTEPLKSEEDEAAPGHLAPPSSLAETAEAARKTTGLRVAFGAPPPPPRLGLPTVMVLLFPLFPLLGGSLTGCVAPAARDLAVRHEQLLHRFDGASVPHPIYTVDDAEPGADGRKMSAAEKLEAWRSAREELLRSAAELRRVLGGE